jgi:hypothetical protein
MKLKRPLISIAVLNEVAPPENRKDLNRLAALKKADVVTGYNFYSGQQATLRGICRVLYACFYRAQNYHPKISLRVWINGLCKSEATFA